MSNKYLYLLYINEINVTKDAWPSKFRTISVNHQYIKVTLIDSNVFSSIIKLLYILDRTYERS